jgi:hypothetical protein
MEQFSFERLNQIDLVDFLASIGIQPKKIKSWHYFYCLPLPGHPDHGATFIVNRRLNRWRETTTRQAGGLIDLAVRVYDCTIGELTAILCAALPLVQQCGLVGNPHSVDLVTIEQTHPIRSTDLERYLWEFRIPLHVARLYCLEGWYYRETNLYHALAFRNDSGGFELFDRAHHYRVQPFGPTHIRGNSQAIAVFRHVLDLLTYVTLFAGPITKLPDFFILNARVDFEDAQGIMSPYRDKHLFLPNDAAGITFSNHAVGFFRNCQDHRFLYSGYPTLNDWICRPGTAPGP